MERLLQKWNGAGNDFLVDVGGEELGTTWNATLARAVCDRQSGIGADGLLLAIKGSDGVRMKLFNADGSEAEMSGNGIRCFAAALRRATNATWEDVDVTTAAGVRRVRLAMDSATSGTGSVEMGLVTLEPTPDGALGAANVGNPHVVVHDDETWDTNRRAAWARELSDAKGGANIEFVQVRHPGRVAMRVYERGVGWTQACGTGSVAVAAVLHRAGLTGERIIVENPGGELVVELHDQHARLSGPVIFERDVFWATA